jgi:hypothetical protein
LRIIVVVSVVVFIFFVLVIVVITVVVVIVVGVVITVVIPAVIDHCFPILRRLRAVVIVGVVVARSERACRRRAIATATRAR